MAKQNYSFEKHQRELKKNKKKAAKAERKLAKNSVADDATAAAPTPADSGPSPKND